MNKYSEWIYYYLDIGYLKYQNRSWFNKTHIGSMLSDFENQFDVPYRIWSTWDVLDFNDKLQFFLFLAEVDQETADALVNFPR